MKYTETPNRNTGKVQLGDNFLVYRNETKYSISQTEYELTKRLLAEFLSRDSFMQDPDGYLIKSLYFDSIDDYDYRSKINGNQNRKKIRLRIYNNDSSFVKFEIKNRFSNYNLKESLVISDNEARKIITGDYDVLYNNKNPIAQKAAFIMKNGLYSPKALVQYRREAYVLPMFDIRVTFDKCVSASISEDLFCDDLLMLPVFEKDEIILEVKYDYVLPQLLKDILSVCENVPTSISKYCFSRERLNNI